MQRLYTRDEYMRRIEWMKNVDRGYCDHHGYHRRISRRDRGGLSRQTLDLLDEVEYDSMFVFKYSQAAEYSGARSTEDQIPKEEKTRRL